MEVALSQKDFSALHLSALRFAPVKEPVRQPPKVAPGRSRWLNRTVLGIGLAAVMAVLVIAAPMNIWTLALVFVLGGVYVAMEETLEDSLAAELVTEEHHGMAFGVLATVNGVGDFLSSILVGALWSAFGTATAFGYSAVLFAAGAWPAGRVHGPARAAP